VLDHLSWCEEALEAEQRGLWGMKEYALLRLADLGKEKEKVKVLRLEELGTAKTGVADPLVEVGIAFYP